MSANGNHLTPELVKVPDQNALAPRSQHELATAAVAAQAKAMVEARYIVALQRPRDIDAARVKLLAACKRPRFAEAARYVKPVGRGIEGPSIRLAEEAARCMTNIDVQIPTIYDDERRRIVRVSATDLEANITYDKDVTIEKTVERNSVKEGQQLVGQRMGSRGQAVYIVLASDDEILNKENALTSKALRACLLRLVPGDILEEAMDQVYATLRDRNAQDPGAERKRIVDGFAALHIMPDRLKEYLGHDLDVTTPAELLDLRGIYTALKDGEATWAEVMDVKRKKDADAKGDDKPQAPAAGNGEQAKKGQANLTDLAAQSKAKREATTGQQPEAQPADGPPPGHPAAPENDPDADDRAAAAPTPEEAAAHEAERAEPGQRPRRR